ncbi:hypothetical protein [Dyella sedimenti]|jgi:hypothetical protein|uniref:hypothetical protein n=1 Tax=Dyella sedimenti TaxID=2919947 RepID=UPI001FAAEDAD|nr:hypothetical protein [Dyella sedimenti]
MRASEFQRWTKIRKQGMLRFVMRSGVVFYGIPMFVIMTYLIPHPRLSTGQSALLWLVAGACYGAALWLVQERRYHRMAGRS